MEAAAAVAVTPKDPHSLVKRGRDGPKPEPAGECVVCRGGLQPDIRAHGHDGWYCERCGLRYHHLPSRPPRRVFPQ